MEGDMFELDLSRFASRRELHEYLKETWELPAYYGATLDALYDVLTERAQPMRIRISGLSDMDERLDGYGTRLLRTLLDVQKVVEGMLVEAGE